MKVVALLPAGRLFDEVFTQAVAPAVSAASAEAIRVPSNLCDGQQLRLPLQDADLVIADLTGLNPNVMYQAGFALGLGRKVLFIAMHLENLPFDPAANPIIGYAGDGELLGSEIATYLSRGDKSDASGDNNPNARVRFQSLFGEILAAHQHEHPGEIYLENPKTFVLVNQAMELALVQDLARRARELGLRLKLM
jgi:hypothetical protein